MGHLALIGRARGQDVNAVVLVHQVGDQVQYSIAGRPDLGLGAHPVASLYARPTLASIHGAQPTRPSLTGVAQAPASHVGLAQAASAQAGGQGGLGVLVVLAVALILILGRK